MSLSWPVPAREMRIKLDRPEITQLRYCEDGQTWREAHLTSSGFVLDFAERDPHSVDVRGSAPVSGPTGVLLDWSVATHLNVVQSVPTLKAERTLSYGRLALLGLVPVGLAMWRVRPRTSQTVYVAAEGTLPVASEYGGYRLIGKLGVGGGADVYLGQNEAGEKAAVKLYKGGDLEDLERFRREVEVTRRLSHPNLVKLYDYGEKDGRVYLILEYLAGGRLRDRLQGSLAPHLAAPLLRPMFAAVAYAHEQGMVHRDLKPENALFDDKGVLKVTDFGLAKTRDSATVTAHGMAMGSPAYMSPEQIQGASRDACIDQYALGVIAFEMLAGRLPYDAEDNIQLVVMHLQDPIPDLPEEVPAPVARVVRRMLQKNSQLRYPSVAEAWVALESALLPGGSQDDDETGRTVIE